MAPPKDPSDERLGIVDPWAEAPGADVELLFAEFLAPTTDIPVMIEVEAEELERLREIADAAKLFFERDADLTGLRARLWLLLTHSHAKVR